MDKNKIKLIFKSEDGKEVIKEFDLNDIHNFTDTANNGIKKLKIIERENEETKEIEETKEVCYHVDYDNEYNIKQLSNGLLNFIKNNEENKEIIDDFNLEYYVKTICNSDDIKKNTKIFFSVLLRFIEDNMQEYISAASNGLANNDNINFQLLENYVKNIEFIGDKFKESDLEEPEKEEQQKQFKKEENKANKQLREIKKKKNKKLNSLKKKYNNLKEELEKKLEEQKKILNDKIEEEKNKNEEFKNIEKEIEGILEEIEDIMQEELKPETKKNFKKLFNNLATKEFINSNIRNSLPKNIYTMIISNTEKMDYIKKLENRREEIVNSIKEKLESEIHLKEMEEEFKTIDNNHKLEISKVEETYKTKELTINNNLINKKKQTTNDIIKKFVKESIFDKILREISEEKYEIETGQINDFNTIIELNGEGLTVDKLCTILMKEYIFKKIEANKKFEEFINKFGGNFKEIKNELDKNNIDIIDIAGKGAEGIVINIRGGKSLKFTPTENSIINEEANLHINLAKGHFTNVLKRYRIDKFIVEESKTRVTSLDKTSLSPQETTKNDKDIRDNFSIMSVMGQCILGLHSLNDHGLVNETDEDFEKVCLFDIKPENIFIDKNGKVTYGDFGFATVLKDGRENRNGTPMYIPFDKLRNEKSEVFSLGLSALEMFTGKTMLNFLIDVYNKNSETKVKASDLVDIVSFNRVKLKAFETITNEITPDIINLEKLFPTVKDFKGKENEIKNKMCDLLKHMVEPDQNKRRNISQIKEEYKELVEYLMKEIGIDPKKDLKLTNKDLYEFGIFEQVDKEYIEEKGNKINRQIDELNVKIIKKEEKENDTILKLTGQNSGDVALSEEVQSCLYSIKYILNCDYDMNNNINDFVKNFKKLRENFKNSKEELNSLDEKNEEYSIAKEGYLIHKREYLLVSKFYDDLYRLQMATGNNEKLELLNSAKENLKFDNIMNAFDKSFENDVKVSSDNPTIEKSTVLTPGFF